MNNLNFATRLIRTTFISACCLSSPIIHASESNWSLVPYAGLSLLGDQNPDILGSTDISDGSAQVDISTGFTAGLGVRYDYENSPWSSELGWEYRSNDAKTTSANGTVLSDGNYASNIFYINTRYALQPVNKFIPWIGAGITWTQEIDLDSEDANGERSWSDSGSVGLQAMVGANYNLTDRLYLTGELRYSNQTDLKLEEEGGTGTVRNIDYQPLTTAIGIGIRF